MALYADIITIEAPATANAGDEVSIKVNVKNLYTSVISIAVTGVVLVGGVAWRTVTFPTASGNLNPGYVYQFSGHFTMPNENVVVSIMSFFYATDGEWHSDDVMVAHISLTGALLAEIKDIWYWDPILGGYNMLLTEPPTISIGSEAGAQFNVYNVSSGYLDLGLFITAFDPFGNPLGANIAGPTRLPPGGSLGSHYREVTKFPGTYKFTVDIITSSIPPYGIIGTLKNVPVAYVVGVIPPLAGHVYEPFVLDATTGETSYSLSLPVEIIGRHKVIVGIHWMNDGSQTATFTPTFKLVDPSGISREVQTFNTVLSPTEHTGGQTGKSVELNKVGMWKIHATLKVGGTLLDEETWDAVSVTTLLVEEVQIENVALYVVR